MYKQFILFCTDMCIKNSAIARQQIVDLFSRSIFHSNDGTHNSHLTSVPISGLHVTKFQPEALSVVLHLPDSKALLIKVIFGLKSHSCWRLNSMIIFYTFFFLLNLLNYCIMQLKQLKKKSDLPLYSYRSKSQ